MTPNQLAAYRADSTRLAKYAVSPTRVCKTCHKSRSIAQYRPGATVCRHCKGVK